jgi:hypothetical protein
MVVGLLQTRETVVNVLAAMILVIAIIMVQEVVKFFLT